MPRVIIKEDCSWYGHGFRGGETALVSYETFTDLASAGKIEKRLDSEHLCNRRRKASGEKADFRIRNRHEGETIFILGCGPSIANVDFSLLEGKTTIGVNGILHAFDPEYLLWLDNAAVAEMGELIERARAVKFCADRVRAVIHAIRFRRYAPGENGPLLSPDFERGLYWSRTSVFPAINLAVLFGAARIVLAGVDLNDASHFYGRAGRKNPFPGRDRILADFSRLAKYAGENRIEIINASMKSAVTCFTKKPLAEIIEM